MLNWTDGLHDSGRKRTRSTLLFDQSCYSPWPQVDSELSTPAAPTLCPDASSSAWPGSTTRAPETAASPRGLLPGNRISGIAQFATISHTRLSPFSVGWLVHGYGHFHYKLGHYVSIMHSKTCLSFLDLPYNARLHRFKCHIGNATTRSIDVTLEKSKDGITIEKKTTTTTTSIQ